jgi:hypothetical protein
VAAHRVPLEDRFRRYVDRTPTCWNWTANRPGGRYGHLKYLGKTLLVHRVAYELFVGPIADGLWVLHHCDNPACVRPDHLYLGTPQRNVLDKIERKRGGLGELHGRTQLTVSDVTHIREIMSAPGSKMGRRKALIERYGISPTSISRIASGKQWRYMVAA